MGLAKSVTPPIYQEKAGVDMPIEKIGATDKTVYVNIDLKIDNMKNSGKAALPMTAVFAPNPAALSGEVNVLLWLHGDKSYWEGNQKHKSFSGESIQYYLKTWPMTKLREFILQTKKNFLLVAPTLNDQTGGRGGDVPGGLLLNPGDAEGYLYQAVNAANKYLGAKGTKPGKIVLAAHSGGGNIQSRMARDFAGDTFGRMNEVWCFDCTYWGAGGLEKWAERPHDHAKLFVYSLGESGRNATGDAAREILKLAKPSWPLQPKGPGVFSAIGAQVRTMVRDVKSTIRSIAHDPPAVRHTKMTDIEVLIEQDPANKINPAWAAYKGGASGHYESIPKYLPLLVERSRNLA
jgi:hypothetical protein